MGGEDDTEGIARLQMSAPPIEWILQALGGCSQFSGASETRGVLGDDLATVTEPHRGALDAFPFVTGLELTI